MSSPDEPLPTAPDEAKTARHGDPLLSTAQGEPEEGSRHGADTGSGAPADEQG